MQLPIDVKAVLDEATNIEEARNTELSVTVYVDATAPGDVQAHARQAFASSAPNARVSIIYLDGRQFAPYDGDDMACIVAGTDPSVGAYAFDLRNAGVPTMVLAADAAAVEAIARDGGHPLPKGDVLSPDMPQPLPTVAQDAPEPGTVTATPVLDEASAAALSERMGGWVVEACRDKRLAFALAFPFVRKPLSLEVVRSTSLQNAGVGLLVVIPGADLPVMTLNQAKMLLMIAAAYGEELSIARVKELAAVVGGAFACRAVARQVVAVVPALGWAVKAAIGYTGTLAMGRAAIEYFEGGANLSKLTDAVARARDKAVQAAAKRAAASAQQAGAQAVNNVRARATSAVRTVRGAMGPRTAGGSRGQEAPRG